MGEPELSDVTAPADWADAQPRLRSVLRPVSAVNARYADEHRPWVQQLWPFVHELVVVDLPQARVVVTTADTQRWGVDAEELFATARANLAGLVPAVDSDQLPLHIAGDGSSYCDSAVLVTDWLARLAPPDGRLPLVFFPGDECLLIGTDDPAVAPRYFAAAEELYREAAIPISPQAYTVSGGAIVPFDQVGPHPLRSLAVRARSVLAEREYAQQTEFLRERYAALQLAPYVGAVATIETPRGLCTVTVWGQGVPWELPVTDYVAMVTEDREEKFLVPFDVVADVVGLKAHPGMLPVRCRAWTWPSEDVVDVLKTHAVDLPKSQV
jgi:hypothetical protein